MKTYPPIIQTLEQLEEESIERGIPIIGREKGTWLYKKVKELKPRKVLELGTANGYSGCILGSEGAQLTTIEINPQIMKEAEMNFKKYKIAATVLVGDGVEKIKEFAAQSTNREKFDLIFIDFVKNQYFSVLEDSIFLIKKGGYIIADNITFPGCQNYKHAVLTHPQLETEIVLIKDDGLACSRKV